MTELLERQALAELEPGICSVCAHVEQTPGKPCKLCGAVWTPERAEAVRRKLAP